MIPEGKEIPPRSVVLGAPGKIVREVREQDLERIRWGVQLYVERWRTYAHGFRPQA